MRYRISPAALDEIDDIFMQLAPHDPVAAQEMMDALTHCFRFLARNPRAGALRSNILRGVWMFPVGPYLIFYRLADTSIDIISVLHSAIIAADPFGSDNNDVR